MRIFKNKTFHRWTQEVELSDNALKKTIDKINKGLYQSNLRKNIFKKHVALDGCEKSGETCTIVAFRNDSTRFLLMFLQKYTAMVVWRQTHENL